jgi:hypothetical protein
MPGFEPAIIGQKVIVMDPNTGNHSNFLSLKHADKSFRPVGVKFDIKGDALYVVSIGKTEIRTDNPVNNETSAGLYPFSTIHAMPWAFANSGIIWKITRENNNNNTAGVTTTLPANINKK